MPRPIPERSTWRRPGSGARAISPVNCSSRKACLPHHRAGELQFFGHHTALAQNKAFSAFLAPLWNTKWVVYCKHPFGGPQEVLRYLARYTHRVAISNRRLMACNEKGVTFKWKDYRIEGPTATR